AVMPAPGGTGLQPLPHPTAPHSLPSRNPDASGGAVEPTPVRPTTFNDPAPQGEPPVRDQEFAVVRAQQGGGRQEPAMSLEWVGPAVAKLNQPAEFSLVVRNISVTPVGGVLVRVRLPEGVSVQATEPKAITEGNVIVWELGDMMRQQ